MVLVAIVAFLPRRERGLDLTAMAVALAFFGAAWLLDGWPKMPPNKGIAAISWCVAATGVLALVAPKIPGSRLAGTLAVLWMIAATRFMYGGLPVVAEFNPWARWEPAEIAFWWAGGSMVVVAIWGSICKSTHIQGGPLPLLILAGTAGVGAKVIMDGGSAKLAHFSGALATGLTIAALPAFFRRDLRITPGLAMVASFGIFGCQALGFLLTQGADHLGPILVLLVPTSLWVGYRSGLRERGLVRWLAMGGTFLLLAGAAAWRSTSMVPEPWY
jgi:hypothetical protein